MNFIAIDFETANSYRSSICSLGLAIVENGKLQGTEHFLVKPLPDYYDWFNSQLHGIDDSHTRDQKTFRDQWKELQKYFHGQVVVAHNAAFDCSVLRNTLDNSELGYPDFDYHCTWRLSQATLPLRNHKLSDVSRHFDIELNHHHAESDARAAALIALRLCEMYEANSLEELSANLGFTVGKIISGKNSYRAFSKKKVRRVR